MSKGFPGMRLLACAAFAPVLLFRVSLAAEVMPAWSAIGDDASANACIVRGVGQSPVRYGDLVRKGSVELPVDGPSGTVRWDFLLPCDLSQAKGVEFDIRCDDLTALNGAMFYFKSGKGWYSRNINLEEDGKWCRVRMLRTGCGKEGKPGGWDGVERMRISFFRSSERKTTTAAVADFSIIPAGDQATDEKVDRARIDAEVREFVKSVPGKKGERRLAWCHSAWGLKGRDWDGSVRFLKKHGFTDLIANLCWADRAFYASDVLPVDASIATKGDMLEQCLAACRKWGVKCHVWRVCYNMGARFDKGRVARFAAEGRLVKMFDAKSKSPWGSTFCPSHPENVRLEVAAMAELVAKGVDGIHYDYIRYADQNVCFCDGCRGRFERDCGVTVANWPGGVRLDKALAKKWADWRCSNITRVVQEVSGRVRKEHPEVEISAAVRAGISGAYVCDGQDWVGWAKNGWVDFLCPMDYTPSTAFFRSTYLDQAKAIAGTRAKLYPGIGLSCWKDDGTDAMKMAKHIQALRKDGLDGFTVFNFDARAERAFPILSTGPTRDGTPERITLERKDFSAHVQGVCTDGTNIYWSMTYDLVKTDRTGRELARYSDKFHMGDLCWRVGRIYVGVNRMAERGARRGDEVWVFEADKLERIKIYPTPQTIWCNNGIEWHGDRFWIIGNAPLYGRYNYVFEYTEDFKFVQCRPIDSGWTKFGVQTICLWGGKMLFGCYGDGKDPQMPHKASTFAVDVKDLTRKTLNIEFPCVIAPSGKAEEYSAEGMLVLDGEIWTAHGITGQKTSDGSGKSNAARCFGAYIRRDKNLERKL